MSRYAVRMIVTTEEYHSAFVAFRAKAVRGVLDTGRYRMRYFVWGSGPPVVFVHGMADHASAFVMSMHRLVERFTCIAYELPDGLTDGAYLARYTYQDYTADLLALLDHLSFPRVAVVGSSFGSTIMLASLATAPDRFTHGVSQNGFAYRPLTRWQRQLALSARFWPGWFADWPEIYRFVTWQVERPTLSILPPEVARFYLANGGQTPIRASAIRSLLFGRTDLRPLLPSISIPMLLLTGDHDPLVPPSCAADLERGLPNVRRVEFVNCGHHPQYSHPGPMSDAIATFLA
ncbi:MAG: alpha/beta hydrolase [Planctomycetes bacterium]|nr:alpha/beta hydrolase [Planctomycetota bacterium]